MSSIIHMRFFKTKVSVVNKLEYSKNMFILGIKHKKNEGYSPFSKPYLLD